MRCSKGWFSSIPGPTICNRAFAHYGTSFGNVDMNMFLVNDADRAKIPTIYERLAAGNVAVTIHAESEEGFDRGKLQNGVLEPLI